MSEVEVCVGRVSKAHGVRGEVAVEVRTDEPERRFVPGASLRVESRHPGLPVALTVESTRTHQDRLLVRFTQVPDRSAAEPLRGALLMVGLTDADLEPGEAAEDGEYYDHQLIGLAVVDPSGTALGAVRDVLHHGAQDLLVVETTAGREAMVPFVTALVPEVDPVGGRLVVADRPGLIAGEADE